MKKPMIITYKGKKVVYLDFSNLNNNEQVLNFEKVAREFIQKQNINSALVLTNVENMYFNNELRTCFINSARANEPIVKASALIGLYGLTSFIYNDFLKQSGRNILALRTKTEALEYLASFD